MPELEAMTRDVVAEQFAKLGGSLEVDAAEPATDAGGDPGPAPAAEPERAAPAAGRDEKGRFAKGGGTEPAAQGKDPASPPDAAAGQVVTPAVAQAAPVVPELKAPQDWRAAPREKWASLPREAQEEILRTYGDTRKTLDRAAALEKEIEPWRAATQPYSHLFGGAQPHQVIGGLLRSLSVLQTGHPQQRAQVVASIVRDYIGTDEAALTMLGQVIHGGGASQPVQAPQALTAEQVRQLARQEWEAAQAQSQSGAALQTWREFEPTADLLTEDGVRQDLADLAGKWTRENPGQAPTKEVFQKLYDRACAMNEKAAAIVNQRKEAEAAGKANASTQARTAAAVGIKNEPAVAGSPNEPADTVREEVKRQYSRLSNKRR